MIVGFSYTTSSDWFYYRPIVKELRARGHSDVHIEGGDPFWVDSERIQQFLKDNSAQLSNSIQEVDLVISTRELRSIRGCIFKKAVRLMRGSGCLPESYSANQLRGFTRILVPGLRQRSFLESCVPLLGVVPEATAIGLPVTDSYIEKAGRTEYELLYAPTQGTYSSLSSGEDIAKLSSQFSGKCVFRSYQNESRLSFWASLFRDYNWTIDRHVLPLCAMAKLTRIVLTDLYSGATLESALCNPSVIALDPGYVPGVFSYTLSRYVRTIALTDLEKITEPWLNHKEIPLADCDYRGRASKRCVDVLESIV